MSQNMEFLYLSQEDVIAAGGLEMAETLNVVERVFSMVDNGEALEPLSPMENWDGGEGQKVGVHFGALAGDVNLAGVKWITVNPTNPAKRGQPTIIDVTVVSDPQTGFPIAVMDGTLISARRTGAIAGIAAKYLARPDSEVVGLIGLGVITRAQIAALKEVLKQIKQVKVYDIKPERAEAFADEMEAELSLPMEIAGSARHAVEGSDVVAVATAGVTLATSYIEASWLKEGSFYCNMGSFDEKFQVIAQADKFVLDTPIQLQCEDRSLGLFHRHGLLDDKNIVYMGEIINGKEPGREDERERTYFKSWGVTTIDVAEAYRVYERAKEEGIGQTLELWQQPFWV